MPINTDFGHLCNLIAMFDQRALAKRSNEDSNCTIPNVSGSNKIVFIATSDEDCFEEFQRVFESREDCIEFCLCQKGWAWKEIPYYYR